MTVYLVVRNRGLCQEPFRVYANLEDALACCRERYNCEIEEYEVLGEFPKEDQ